MQVDIILMLVVALVLLVVIHIIFVRVMFKDDVSSCQIGYFVAIMGCNIILPVVFTVQHISNQEYMAGLIYLLIFFNSIAYIYFHIYNMSETSVRIKILSLIYTKIIDKRGFLCKVYTTMSLVNSRLNRLIKLKQIKNINGYYELKSSALLRIANMFLVLKKLITN